MIPAHQAAKILAAAVAAVLRQIVNRTLATVFLAVQVLVVVAIAVMLLAKNSKNCESMRRNIAF